MPSKAIRSQKPEFSFRSLDDNGNLLGTSRGSWKVSKKGYRERKMESFSPFQVNFQAEKFEGSEESAKESARAHDPS